MPEPRAFWEDLQGDPPAKLTPPPGCELAFGLAAFDRPGPAPDPLMLLVSLQSRAPAGWDAELCEAVEWFLVTLAAGLLPAEPFAMGPEWRVTQPQRFYEDLLRLLARKPARCAGPLWANLVRLAHLCGQRLWAPGEWEAERARIRAERAPHA